MEIIRAIEMTKEEHDTLEKILNDFNKSSISKKYCIGQAISKMTNDDKNYLEDFKIDDEDMTIVKRALNWFWLILDDSLGDDTTEFINKLVFNEFDAYEIKIIM